MRAAAPGLDRWSRPGSKHHPLPVLATPASHHSASWPGKAGRQRPGGYLPCYGLTRRNVPPATVTPLPLPVGAKPVGVRAIVSKPKKYSGCPL
jgi:hypothetical protein